MENVAEMKNGFSQSYTEELMDRLTEAGYSVIHDVLNAAYFGVPQRRRRAFFLAARDGVIPMFPEKTHFPVKDEQPLFKENTHVTVWEAIGDLPKLQHGEGEEILKYTTTPQNEFQRVIRKGSKNVINHQARKLSPIQHLRLSSLKPGEGIKNLPEAIRPKSGYSGAYGRLTKDMVAPTITRWVFHPGSGRYGHPVQSRVITIREAARIQAFPDTFKFEGTYIQQSHQIGNAVPSLLAQRIGEKFLSLSKTSPKKVIQETRQVVKV
jgi:DNA (cytosine-5)-methyltransferase 1